MSDILNKIDTKWLENALTDDERVELMRLAREKAIAENSYANADKRFEDIYRQLSEMNNAIKELTAKVNANNEESGEEIEPELFGDAFDIDLACDMDFMIERCDKILHCNFLKECTWEKM